MIRIQGRVLSYGVAAVLCAVAGCMSLRGQPSSAEAKGNDSAGVTVSDPTLSDDGGVLLIRGTAHADAAGPDLVGRLDIELIGATGQPIEHCNCHLLHTKVVPGDPARIEPYEARWDVHPTRDQTIRVHFVDQATASAEDAQESATSVPH